MGLKVLVVDDHALIRQGLRSLLAQLAGDAGPVEVLEASGYLEALQRIEADPGLDLVMLDLRMPDVSGFAALADIEDRHPDLPVVIMTGEEDPALVREAFEHGALGFIPKSSPPPVILAALRLVLSGGTYVPPQIMASPPRTVPPAPKAAAPDTALADNLGLTPRQSDVLALLLAGKSNKVISRDLNLAEGTVKNHVAAVLKALNVDTRVQAVIAAARLGLK
ncbi:MAG TPA: response regulator transcription factor [Usitatibacter sp.]|nr:response regulator transcription factor [Usitatibacter sp.]